MQTTYPTEISERVLIYRDGLSEMQMFLLFNQFEDAVESGLKTILKACNGIAPETNNLTKLADYCKHMVDGFPNLNIESKPLKVIANIIEGILVERQAFYQQLENLTH